MSRFLPLPESKFPVFNAKINDPASAYIGLPIDGNKLSWQREHVRVLKPLERGKVISKPDKRVVVVLLDYSYIVQTK